MQHCPGLVKNIVCCVYHRTISDSKTECGKILLCVVFFFNDSKIGL